MPGCYPGLLRPALHRRRPVRRRPEVHGRRRRVAEVLHGALPDRRRLRREPLDRRAVRSALSRADLRAQARGADGVPDQQPVPVEHLLGTAAADDRRRARPRVAPLRRRCCWPSPCAAGRARARARRREDRGARARHGRQGRRAGRQPDRGDHRLRRPARRRSRSPGKEEFRARLGVESERRTQACLDDISCLGRAGVSLGVRRIVAGSVGTRGKQVPVQPEPQQRPGRQGREPRLPAGRGRRREPDQRRAGRVERAVQAARRARRRSRSRPSPPGARVSIDNAYLGITPLISPTLIAGKHNVRVEATDRFPWTSRVEVRPGQELQIRLTPDNLPLRRRWPANTALRVDRARGRGAGGRGRSSA